MGRLESRTQRFTAAALLALQHLLLALQHQTAVCASTSSVETPCPPTPATGRQCQSVNRRGPPLNRIQDLLLVCLRTAAGFKDANKRRVRRTQLWPSKWLSQEMIANSNGANILGRSDGVSDRRAALSWPGPGWHTEWCRGTQLDPLLRITCFYCLWVNLVVYGK